MEHIQPGNRSGGGGNMCRQLMMKASTSSSITEPCSEESLRSLDLYSFEETSSTQRRPSLLRKLFQTSKSEESILDCTRRKGSFDRLIGLEMDLDDEQSDDSNQGSCSTEDCNRGSSGNDVKNDDDTCCNEQELHDEKEHQQQQDDVDEASCNEQQVQDEGSELQDDNDATTEEESSFRKGRTMSTPTLKSTAAVNTKEYCRRHSSASSSGSSVHFGTIQIREYGRTISDNPSVSEGPPIGLTWSYQSTSEYSVQDFEDQHPPRRNKEEFLIPPQVREHMLLGEWQHTMRDVRDSTMESKRVRQQREASMHTPPLSEKTQELLQSSKRKLLRLKKGTTSKKEMDNLWQSAAAGRD